MNRIGEILESWVVDIKKLKDCKDLTTQTVMIGPRLIVYAWTYANHQINEVKNRFGNSINMLYGMSNIFVNKVAEIAIVLNSGYTEEDIFNGNSPISHEYISKDERDFIEQECKDTAGNKILISGYKKYTYPTVLNNNYDNQVIVYIDAKKLNTKEFHQSLIHIENNQIKVTILGVATKACILANRDQNKIQRYTNVYSAFTGFDQLVNVPKLIFACTQHDVPEYVETIANMSTCDIENSVQDIAKQFSMQPEQKVVSKINYADLFDPILKKSRE